MLGCHGASRRCSGYVGDCLFLYCGGWKGFEPTRVRRKGANDWLLEHSCLVVPLYSEVLKTAHSQEYSYHADVQNTQLKMPPSGHIYHSNLLEQVAFAGLCSGPIGWGCR
jgi:hypothetical protein